MSLIISEVLGGRSVDRTRMTRIGADDHGSLWGKLRVVGFTRVTRATCVVLGRLAQGLKWRLPVLMFGILLAGCGGQAQPTASQPAATQTPFATSPPIVIVAMGDSLTEGFGLNLEDAYPAQLERRLLADGHNVTVINAGNSGETSSGAALAGRLGAQPGAGHRHPGHGRQRRPARHRTGRHRRESGATGRTL